MVAHVLRLRFALLVGAFRGRPGQVARVAVGFVFVIIATIVGCWALLTLVNADVDVTQAVIVLAGSALTLACALGPIVAGRVDPLDPRRFAVFGLPERPLAFALVVAGVLGLAVLALIALAVCGVIVWAAHGVSLVIGILSALLGIATCALLIRVSQAIAATVFRERRSRELTGLIVVALIVFVVPAGVFVASLEWDGQVPTQLEAATSVLALTPLAAAWAMPGLLAEGGPLGLALLIAVATLGLLWWAWSALVARLLTTTEHPAVVPERGGLGWFALTPGTPGGAIAARSLTYWLRDSRYIVNFLIIPVAAVLMTVPLLIVGVSPAIVALVPMPIIALLFGWLPHNDVAYDSTAIWMHIASGVRGAADRLGRLLPILLIGIPILAIGIPIATALYGRWALLPALAGVCISLFLTGLGLSSIASVVAPYAVTRPGDSAFQQPQRSGSGGLFSQALVLLGTVVLSAPALWWGWVALTDDIDEATTALWTGIGIGLGVFIVGVAVGSALFRVRGVRLMEFAATH